MIRVLKLFFRILKNQFPVLFFFILFFSILHILNYLDNISFCFPVTVIAIDREIIDDISKKEGVCSSYVISEKMTFDSSIFNHYETPPVKDIFLLTIKLPYHEWENIKNIDHITVEANPFIESTVEKYFESRLKWLSIAFILLFLAGLFLFASSMPSKKESSELFKINTIVTFALFFSFSIYTFFNFSFKIFPLAALTLSSTFLVYIMFLLLYYRFVFEKKTGDKQS